MLELLKDLLKFDDYEVAKKEAASYVLPPSIAQKFSWGDYNNGFFELNAGKGSVAVVYELTPVSTEGQPMHYLDEIRQGIEEIFRGDTFRQYYDHESPWIVQVYVSDDFNLDPFLQQFKEYIEKNSSASQYSKVYLEIFRKHFDYFVQAGGIFEDSMSGAQFQGRVRRVRLVLYRRMHSKSFINKRSTPEKDLHSVCVKLEKALQQSGILFKKYTEYDFYCWMLKWLSPKPKGFKDPDEYIAKVPFPMQEDEKSFGFDLTQAVFTSIPVSDSKNNIWYFDELPHKFIPIVGFSRIPASGHLTAERKMTRSDDPEKIRYYAPFDHMPEGATFVMTIVIQNQEFRKQALERLKKRARKCRDRNAQKAGEEAMIAEEMIAEGNYIFPVCMGVYVRGKNQNDLLDKEESTLAVLATNGFKPLPEDKDSLKIDRYLRFLPMNYNYTYDKKYMLQSRLCSVKQIASVLPVYGRTRGTGHPCLVCCNRLGEPFFVDPIFDRQNNAHGLILGTTGSGKSSMSAYFLMQMMAVYMPRMVIIDAGGSFRYMVEFWERLGIKVNKIEIKMEYPEYTLNPFVETEKMLHQVDAIEKIQKTLNEYEVDLEQRLDETVKEATVEEKQGSTENRDYLMEFMTAAMLMITGGEQKEIDALDRQDRFLILEAIKNGARSVLAAGYEQMIPADLADALEKMANKAEASTKHADKLISARLMRMANGARAFINVPINAMYFNQRGKGLPDSDVIWFEMGLLKDDRPENEAPRALAFITMMNNTMSKAEKYKDSGRPYIFYADECHTVTSKPLTAASVVQCTKMSRKVNLWIWLATQNVSDFPDSARKAVSMLEYKIVLWCDKKERKRIAEFIELTPEQDAVINSLRKVKRKYVEGVLLSNSAAYLFRNIPPREVLALAMTDGDENAWRRELMQKFNCDGIEASFLIAQNLRGEEYDLDKIRSLWGG
ncbi:MAG: conjugative transfer ATPase [Gammaproteobacteria bacterium]|nr:conjugative transfer ATPase [Gammaproteobacteria bacterium]